jgi:hypothetical protein
VNRLIENLLGDKQQLEKAETFLLQLDTEYAIKSLKKNLEDLSVMPKDSGYANRANALKQKLAELLQDKNRLTQEQNRILAQLWTEYNMLT